MIKRLNHAVLWVRDAQRSAAFYTDVLGFEVVASMGGKAVFLRADGSTTITISVFSVSASGRNLLLTHLGSITWRGKSTRSRSSLGSRQVGRSRGARR